MNSLLQKIEKMKRSNIRRIIKERMNEFKRNDAFKELCFCILTANFNAQRAIEMQSKIDDGFLFMSKKQLAKTLRENGHRFPETRAQYIIEARKWRKNLKKIASLPSHEAREWLVKNVKGIGYKEASHFLRNIGRADIAIIDFHIIDILAKHKIIEKPKTITKRRYMEIENKLNQMAKKVGTNLAELDLYLWYLETGKVLK